MSYKTRSNYAPGFSMSEEKFNEIFKKKDKVIELNSSPLKTNLFYIEYLKSIKGKRLEEKILNKFWDKFSKEYYDFYSKVYWKCWVNIENTLYEKFKIIAKGE